MTVRREGEDLGTSPVTASGLNTTGDPRSEIAAQNWRTIDTAPDDQRSVLAVHEGSGIQKVAWRRAIGDDRYEYGAGPERVWRPTHWMPLPKPPKRSP